MATLYGLNGLIRGRQGNNVYSVQNGTQVLKIYNPAVANPRTDGQQLQRAKFALAGKISAATPSAALVGMRSGSARGRRGKFVSNLVRNASASLVGTSFNASVPFVNFLFSEGAIPRYSSEFTMSASYSQGATTAAISASVGVLTVPAGAPTGYGELAIVGIFDGAGSPLDEIQVKVRSTTGVTAFSFRQNERFGFVAVCWIVPYVTSSAQSALRTGYLGLNTENNAVLLSADPLLYASAADFGNSLFNNLVLVPAPTQSVSPNRDDDFEVPKKKAKK